MREESEHMGEYFFHMRDEILKKLKTDTVYCEDYKEVNRLREQFPIIDELMEGRNVEQKMELTEQEQKAFKEYVALQEDMQSMTEEEHYYRGHRDCLLYLIRCDMLK